MKRSSVFIVLGLLALAAIFLLPGCSSSSDSKETVVTLDPASTEYPNAGLLVSADSVEDNLNNSDLLVIDARGKAAYDQGHIPGAISLIHNDFWTWGSGLKPVEELEVLLGEAGLTRDMTVVVYDNTTAAWGAAGRIFWMLEYLGCTDVHILNGGWDKWVADGRPTETKTNALTQATFKAAVNNSVRATKESILAKMQNNNFVLIDARTDEEYNGWQLYGEARGGHIPGAVQIPYARFFNADKTVLAYADLKTLLEARGVTADKDVASNCTVGIRSGFVYFTLRLMGYPIAANYDASIIEWAAADETTYPMDKMANYQALVYPGWVDELIKGNNPPTYPGNGFVILYTSYEPRYSENRTDYVGSHYENGHIPGSIFMDTYSIENGPNSEYGDGYEFPEEGNVKPIAELQQFFGELGISKDKTVVVYADDDISMMTAGRTAWALLLAGVNDVRILNGSYAAWVAYGGDIETTPHTLPAANFGGGEGNAQFLATMEDLHDVIGGVNTDAIIVDDREWAEFVGSSNSYYHYFHEYGRIPTARWIGDWVELVRDDTQSLRTYTEVEKNWIASGFSPDKTMYFYCGTGWRSGLYTFYAYLMGWQAANFDGGWFQWSYYDNPRETGNTDKLVSAAWLKQMTDNNNGGKPYVIVETGWGPADAPYYNGHIPRAIWVNTDEIEYDCFNARNAWPVEAGEPACWDRSTTEEEDAAKGLGPNDALPRNWWNIYPDEYLLPAIAYMGINKDATVVVYGDDATAAARLFWTLMYAGVSDVRFLDGGKNAWTSAGYELETTTNLRSPAAFFDPDDPGRITAIHPEYKVDIPYVRDVVNGVETDALIVDIRSWDEYTGATAPYSYIPTSGRIPGAVWGKAGSGPWTMEDYVNDDGTLKSSAEIYIYWNSHGITTDKHLSFYCGTAWRSSLAWFYAYMIGYPEISNFDSSWFEWSMGNGSAYNGDYPVENPILDENPDLP